jgi:hypothetical protein
MFLSVESDRAVCFMKIFGCRLLVSGLVAGAALIAYQSADSAAPSARLAGQHPVLESHKALYSVTLTSSRPGGDYVDVTGKMVVEFTDACDAWTTNQKSLLRTVSVDGEGDSSNSDFTSWENKAGDSYRFSVRQMQNGEVSEFRGKAKRKGANDAGVAEYTKPEPRTYTLPPHFLFQTAQQMKLIESAQKGEHFLSGDMFDGSEGGGASHFNAILLKPVGDPATVSLKSPLLDSPSHRLRVAFYPPEGTGVDTADGEQQAAENSEQPEYEMTMTLHDNGVVSDYDYDYEDFSVHGKLEAIQSIAHPHC